MSEQYGELASSWNPTPHYWGLEGVLLCFLYSLLSADFMTYSGSTRSSARCRPISTRSAAALAHKTGSRLQSAGGQAANALGLSTQVPARAVYLTDGQTRSVQAGGQTIELRHAAPRSLTGAGRTEGTVIQALRHLGPEQINVEVIEHLHQTLTTREKTALRREALNAPGWLVPTLQKVARPTLNLKPEPKLTSVSKSTPVAKSKLNTLAKSEILKPS